MPDLERYEDGDFNVISTLTGITAGADRFWIINYDDRNFHKYTLAGVADGTVQRDVWGRAAGVTFANDQLVTVHDGSPGEARGWNTTGGAYVWRFGFESTNTRARGVCYDGQYLWVVHSDNTQTPTTKVYQYELNGTFIAKYDAPEVGHGSGIVPLGGGFLIADSTNGTTHFYTSELEYVTEFTLDSANTTQNLSTMCAIPRGLVLPDARLKSLPSLLSSSVTKSGI